MAVFLDGVKVILGHGMFSIEADYRNLTTIVSRCSQRGHSKTSGSTASSSPSGAMMSGLAIQNRAARALRSSASAEDRSWTPHAIREASTW